MRDCDGNYILRHVCRCHACDEDILENGEAYEAFGVLFCCKDCAVDYFVQNRLEKVETGPASEWDD